MAERKRLVLTAYPAVTETPGDRVAEALRTLLSDAGHGMGMDVRPPHTSPGRECMACRATREYRMTQAEKALADYDRDAGLRPSVEPPINVGRLRKALDLCGIGLVEGGHPASDWTDALAAEYDRLLPTQASDSKEMTT